MLRDPCLLMVKVTLKLIYHFSGFHHADSDGHIKRKISDIIGCWHSDRWSHGRSLNEKSSHNLQVGQ
jgi:hypothetical protein